MSKVAVVYTSTTGNTEKMAEAVAEGAKSKGAEVVVLTADAFSAGEVANYDAIATLYILVLAKYQFHYVVLQQDVSLLLDTQVLQPR